MNEKFSLELSMDEIAMTSLFIDRLAMHDKDPTLLDLQATWDRLYLGAMRLRETSLYGNKLRLVQP